MFTFQRCLTVLITAGTLALTGCSSADGDDVDSDALIDEESSELRAGGYVFHGTLQVDAWAALKPRASFPDPYTFDGDVGRDDVCVPATVDPQHPVHAWDIEVTEGTVLSVWSESIMLYASGKPNIKDFHVRNLFPESYPVEDVDTTMKLFKKEGSRFKFVASNDDGIAESKGSSIARRVLKPGTFRVFLRAKDPSTTANLGLFVGGGLLNPPEL